MAEPTQIATGALEHETRGIPAAAVERIRQTVDAHRATVQQLLQRQQAELGARVEDIATGMGLESLEGWQLDLQAGAFVRGGDETTAQEAAE